MPEVVGGLDAQQLDSHLKKWLDSPAHKFIAIAGLLIGIIGIYLTLKSNKNKAAVGSGGNPAGGSDASMSAVGGGSGSGMGVNPSGIGSWAPLGGSFGNIPGLGANAPNVFPTTGVSQAGSGVGAGNISATVTGSNTEQFGGSTSHSSGFSLGFPNLGGLFGGGGVGGGGIGVTSGNSSTIQSASGQTFADQVTGNNLTELDLAGINNLLQSQQNTAANFEQGLSTLNAQNQATNLEQGLILKGGHNPTAEVGGTGNLGYATGHLG